MSAAMDDLPPADIQGLILRTYAMPLLRVLALKIEQPVAARRFLAQLAAGGEEDDNLGGLPQLATGTDWSVKPQYRLNMGLTYAGLAAVGLPAASLASFPAEFVEGAAARAERVGDIGESSPEHWKSEFSGADLHILLFLFAQTDEVLEQATSRLRSGYGETGAMFELSAHDGKSLAGNTAHFGYRDGFAQPTIEGGLPPSMLDVLPQAPAGEFLFGYSSQYTDFQYPVPTPDELGRNGSFAAFRILAQDCHGFEQFLTQAAGQTGLDRELIAAKLCGRWRNGVPLSLSPDFPDELIPLEQRNSFDYAPSESMPDALDDRRGYRCPLGSHIRRMNPRSSMVAGNGGFKHRHHPPWPALWPSIRPRQSGRWHRARIARSVHWRKHQGSIRVFDVGLG
jgi:deferrochelatase/peroxidase EfeB